MDWGIIGLIDVIIILLFIITVLVGYHKGFLKKAIGLVSLFVAIVVAFVFCKQFAGFLEEQNIIYGDIYTMIEAKVSGIEGIEYLDSAPDMSVAIQDAVGLPKFIATFLADKITENTSSVEMIAKVTTSITDILMVGVAWLLLFIIVFVGALILKLVVHILRGNAIIKFVDGVIGVVFYVCLLMLFIYSVFAIFKVVGDKEFFTPVQEFLNVDMMLDNPDKFRLSKWIYEHNIVYSLFEFIFSK